MTNESPNAQKKRFSYKTRTPKPWPASRDCLGPCKKHLPIEEFLITGHKGNNDYLRAFCKPCRTATREKQAGNLPLRRKAAAHKLKKKFGLTGEEYQAMSDAQSGVCAICKQEETIIRNGIRLALAVDHDHETGKVRGLLCNHCNKGIGYFKDKPGLIMEAIKYLQERL